MNASRTLFLLAAMLLAGLLAPKAHGTVILSEDFESGALGDRWERYKEDPARGGFEVYVFRTCWSTLAN